MMNRGLYAAASGMTAAERMLDGAAMNLANANTIGYKRDAWAFNERMNQSLRSHGGHGQEVGLLGQGPTVKQIGLDLTQGQLRKTGNAFDIAITSPEGFFQVQTPDGLAYTRDGSFRLNDTGQLVTANGHLVLDEQGNSLNVGEDARLNSKGELEEPGKTPIRLGVFNGAFTRSGGGLYLSADAAPVQATFAAQALEESNVDSVSEMIAMIRLNRAFEMAQRSAASHDESTGRLIDSLNR